MLGPRTGAAILRAPGDAQGTIAALLPLADGCAGVGVSCGADLSFRQRLPLAAVPPWDQACCQPRQCMLTPPPVRRLSLEATCTTMRRASQHWYPEVDVHLDASDTAAAESLAAWLRRHSSCESCCSGAAAMPPVLPPGTTVIRCQSCIRSLPSAGQAHLLLFGILEVGRPAELGASVVLQNLCGSQVASIFAKNHNPFASATVTPAAALAGFGALTSLDFSWEHLAGDLRHVCQLTSL